MKRDLQKMANTDLGILIIGGGILGAGIARDAAIRGIKAGVVEKNDFAWNTTSRCPILSHGVLDYLEEKKPGVGEREILHFISKDITPAVTTYLLNYAGDTQSIGRIKSGFSLSSLFGSKSKTKSPEKVSADEIGKQVPGIQKEGLTGGVICYDYQTQPDRLTICNLEDSFEHGARPANYCEVQSFLQESGKVIGAVVKDILDGKTYEVKAKVIVNATGVTLDKTLGLLSGKETKYIQPTKTVHVAIPKVSDVGIFVSGKGTNQILSITPWKEYSVVGLTGLSYLGDPEQVSVTADDVNTLLNEINRIFPNRKLQKTEIVYAVAGIRAIASAESQIITHGQGEGYPIISVLNGNVMNYRQTAKQVVDIIHKDYGIEQERKSQTEKEPLLNQIFPTEQEAYLRLQDVFEKSPALNNLFKNEKVVKAHDYKFRVALACELEIAKTPADFLLRRSQIGYKPGMGIDLLPTIVELMGSFLGWKPEEKQAQIENYKQFIKAHYSVL